MITGINHSNPLENIKPAQTGNNPSQEIQQLEQQKENISRQLQELQKDTKADSANESKIKQLQQQLEIINQKIQTLRQKKQEAPPTDNKSSSFSQKAAEYTKSNKETSNGLTGTYHLEKDKNGMQQIIYDKLKKSIDE